MTVWASSGARHELKKNGETLTVLVGMPVFASTSQIIWSEKLENLARLLRKLPGSKTRSDQRHVRKWTGKQETLRPKFTVHSKPFYHTQTPKWACCLHALLSCWCHFSLEKICHENTWLKLDIKTWPKAKVSLAAFQSPKWIHIDCKIASKLLKQIQTNSGILHIQI